MNLKDYKFLIQNLPVRQQYFNTKRTTWSNFETQFEWFKRLNDNLFNNNRNLSISRQDVFNTDDLESKIIKAIYWGYPGGMRGNHFIGILNHFSSLIEGIEALIKLEYPTENHLKEFSQKMRRIDGLGLSTYSKLLYFSEIRINSYQCLILDKRLIDVFNKNLFSDFDFPTLRYYNTQDHYLSYLMQMNDIKGFLNTKAENIEQFLFIFGNNIKE